ncbi:MAG: zinc-ribbon domain-containing protein [Oscillochloris sp.]|nr:zinc-ribbon domain-containing protein [Oscillochloris sp.]
MSTCPNCGAQNDPANRFCDQCGARLGGEAAQPAASVSPDQPTMAAPNCPSCGTTVLPGEAFCENCGASLSAIAPTPVPVVASSADAPTMLASPPADTAPASAANQLICKVCGSAVLPGERFCDNCGADLSSQHETPISAVATPAPEQTADDMEATVVAPIDAANPPVDQAPPATAEATPPDAADMPTIAATPEEIAAATAPPPEAAPAPAESATAAPTPAEAAPPPTEEPAATPAPAPAVDPARKAELEAEIARQQQIISQFEQMQSTFGAATPPAVLAGLDEARTALAKARSDLAALSGGTMPAAAAPTATPPPATPEATPTPAAAAPTPAPQAAGPRLVLSDGQEMKLPTDREEIIIGREDPVSNIFPEVDLTPHGGETGGVSRQHARINHKGDQWTITDLNSTNYTRVDGARLEPNTPNPLSDGAKIQFGRIAATFHL